MANEISDHFHQANRKAQETRKIVNNLLRIKANEISKKESTKELGFTDDSEISKALSKLSEPLAKSYFQVKIDLADENRSSWAGTAHEIREVLSTMLKLLAPDEKIIAQQWFRQEPNTSGPTQKQRVRYILQENGSGSKENEVVELAAKLDDMIGDLVRATYSRASDAAHRFKARKEVARIVKYFDAFAHDLLNLE